MQGLVFIVEDDECNQARRLMLVLCLSLIIYACSGVTYIIFGRPILIVRPINYCAAYLCDLILIRLIFVRPYIDTTYNCMTL